MKTVSARERLSRGETVSDSILCPAKINLFLEVTGKRENGYHEIDSVMQKVALCDRLDVVFTKGEGIVITSSDKTVPTGEKNLVYKAIVGYLAKTGISVKCEVYLEKRIPVSAGLAGGSTDAAGMLKILNRNFRAMTNRELAEFALTLGADVPFCLFSSQSRCRGLGEELSPAASLPHCYLLIAKHRRESVSTKDAYHEIDAECFTPVSADGMLKALSGGVLSDVLPHLFNRFEKTVLSQKPIASAIKNAMLQAGALGAMMSGSGPSVFGIFDDENKALAAKKAARELGAFAFVTHPWR